MLIARRIIDLVCNIRVNEAATGSGFYMPIDGRDFLVTAKHMFDDAETDRLEVKKQDGWLEIAGDAVVHSVPSVDIVAVEIDKAGAFPIPSNLEGITYTSDGIVVSSEAFFLGFPYGLG